MAPEAWRVGEGWQARLVMRLAVLSSNPAQFRGCVLCYQVLSERESVADSLTR